MKNTLKSLILGTMLALPIVSLPSKAYSLEEKAVSESSESPVKSQYNFDAFKKALGTRYESLSEKDKKSLHSSYNKIPAEYEDIYMKIIPEIYNNPKKFYKNLDAETREDIKNLNLKNTSDKTKYQYLFPWIKKDFFEKNSADSNPDKILIYFAVCKDIKINIQTPFSLGQNKK